jgi:hypothetical protein
MPLALLVVSFGLIIPRKTITLESKTDLPSFVNFVASVKTGQAYIVTGVYVPGVLAFPVVAQPAGDPAYVSTEKGKVTQFSAANKGVIGLLAHNNLAGATFSGLEEGQEVRIVYGDGNYVSYWIDKVDHFQALEPLNVRSEFHDPVSNRNYSATQIFDMFYTGKAHVTFQTCIAKNGEASWGRLFVTAVPHPLAAILSPESTKFLINAWQSLLAASR